MNKRLIAGAALAVAAAFATGGCMSAGGSASAASVERAGGAVAQPACAPGAPLLPLTRLCQAQATALLLPAPDPGPAPDGCAWTVNEARVLEGGALLYRALRCNGRTAQLEFVPGARAASLDLVKSPFGPQASADRVAAMFDVGGRDAKAVILEAARRAIGDPAQSARCQVREMAADEAHAAGALVVDEVPVPAEDGVRFACGEFGYDGGAQSFWRVSQDIAWYFTLGNDTAPVDAASFTLIRRGESRRWVRS
jgi:hypothetical protein